MKSLFVALSILLICINTHAQSIKELIEKGTKLHREEKYEEALSISDQILALDSNNYEGLVLRGKVYSDLKDPDLALQNFSKAIGKQPDSALAYHYRAHIWLTHMYSNEAIHDNSMAIRLTRNDTVKMSSYINRGAAKAQKRDFQGAYEDYIKALDIDPDNLGAINNIATVLDELGRREEALQYLFRAIKMDSSFNGPYVNIGFQYTKMGRHKEALEYFDKALTLDPDDGVTYNNKGYALYSLKRYDEALKSINKSMELYPGNSYAYKNRALVYLATKQKDKACADLQRAIDMNFTAMYGDEVQNLIKQHCSKSL